MADEEGPRWDEAPPQSEGGGRVFVTGLVATLLVFGVEMLRAA